MNTYQGLRITNSQHLAVIEIFGPIGVETWDPEYDRNTAEKMNSEIKKIRELNADSILVKINSLGGALNHALAIYDLLKEQKNVTTQVNGFCASAATIISMAGSVRKMSKNALYLIHQCTSYIGSANEERLTEELETQKKVNERILSIYTDASPDKTKEIVDLLKANSGNGKWISADEAKDLNFITEIYNDKETAPSISNEYLNRAGLPLLPSTDEGGVNILQDIKDFISQFLNKPQNKIEMKNLFPAIFAIAAIAEATTYDEKQGHTFTDEQLKKLENKLALCDKLQTQLDEAHRKNTEDETKIADAQKENERLQKIIDEIPANFIKPDAADPASKDSITNYVNNSPIYQQIKSEL